MNIGDKLTYRGDQVEVLAITPTLTKVRVLRNEDEFHVPTARLESGVARTRVKSNKPNNTDTVVRALIEKPMTDDEVEALTSLPHQSVSAVTSKLRSTGQIKQIGKRETRTGSLAGVNHVVDPALIAQYKVATA